MKNIQYPIQLIFKISTLSNDFTAVDAQGQTICYVRQKMFKLKEEIIIFADETRKEKKFKINANKWLDFSTTYTITDLEDDKEVGKIARKGWSSLWKANYNIFDQKQQQQYNIREENAWVKVMDGLLGEIPILGMLTGYLFNPSYIVTNQQSEIVVRLKKEPSFWGRRFTIDKLGMTDKDDDERLVLSLMMLVLLERKRG